MTDVLLIYYFKYNDKNSYKPENIVVKNYMVAIPKAILKTFRFLIFAKKTA